MALRRRDLLGLLLGAPLIAWPRPADAVSGLVIGHLSSFTGYGAVFGIAGNRGIELALDTANAEGGVRGVPLILRSADDHSRAEDVAPATTELLRDPALVGVIGPVTSSGSIVCGPLFQSARVPMLAASATSPKVTQVGDYVLRACFVDPVQGTALATYLSDRGITRAALLRDDGSDYSAGLAAAFTEAFIARGGAIVAAAAYTGGTQFRFREELTPLLAAAPEVLVLPGYYTEVGLVAREARELGFTGLFAGGDGWDSERLLDIGRQAIVGGVYTNHWAADDPDPTSRRFVEAFTARYGEAPDAVAALSHDAAGMLVAALRTVGTRAPALLRRASPTARAALRAGVRDALNATSGFPGMTGPVTIGPDREARRAAVIVEVTAEGPRFLTRVGP